MVKITLFPKSWIPAVPYNLGTQVGNFAFLSGRIATANDCQIISGPDLKAQTEVVIDKMVEYLVGVGMGLDDVVQTTVYLQSLDNFAGMNEVYSARFQEPYLARTTVRADLAGAGPLVEIFAIAGRA